MSEDNWTMWAVWAAIAVYAVWEARNWWRGYQAQERRVRLRREWAAGTRPGCRKRPSRRAGGPPRTGEYISGGRDDTSFHE